LNEIKYDYVDSKEHFYLQYHVIATENRHETTLQKTNDHTRSQGRGQRGTAPPKFLENTVLLCIERRFSNQNSVIRLKSNILPPNISGLATPLQTTLQAMAYLGFTAPGYNLSLSAPSPLVAA